MAKKPAVKKTEPAVEQKPAAAPKARTSKPGSNPFVQQHPRNPGKSASGSSHRGSR